MAIVLPNTFVTATSRSGSEVQANLEAVRTWLDGQIDTADISADAVQARHIVRPEHYGFPTICSLGVGSDYHGRRADITLQKRAIFCHDVAGTAWVTCPELAATIYVERSSWVKVRARFHAWVPMCRLYQTSNPGNHVLGTAGYARLFINGVQKLATNRRVMLHDWGEYTPASMDKREHSMIWTEGLTEGEYDIAVMFSVLPPEYNKCANPIDDTASVEFYGSGQDDKNAPKFVNVTTRTFTVEVDTLFT